MMADRGRADLFIFSLLFFIWLSLFFSLSFPRKVFISFGIKQYRVSSDDEKWWSQRPQLASPPGVSSNQFFILLFWKEKGPCNFLVRFLEENRCLCKFTRDRKAFHKQQPLRLHRTTMPFYCARSSTMSRVDR